MAEKTTNFTEFARTLKPEFFLYPNGLRVRDGISCSMGCPALSWCKSNRKPMERRTCADRFLEWANEPKLKKGERQMNEELERVMLEMAVERGVPENLARIMTKLSKHTTLMQRYAQSAVTRNGSFEQMEFALTQVIDHAQAAIKTLADFRKAVGEEANK